MAHQAPEKKKTKKKNKKPIMLGPVLKFKKYHKDCIRRTCYSDTQTHLKKHDYGLKSIEAGRLNPKQLETIRRTITRRVHHKKDKYVIHSKPKWPVTKKARGIRMGKGKGAVHYYTSPVSSGSILYQIEGKSGHLKVLSLLKKVAKKLPTKTRHLVKPLRRQEIFKDKKQLIEY
jgi:large subunit ribosomal protein L16